MTNEEREKLIIKMHGAYTSKTNRGGFYEREIIAMGAALAVAEREFAKEIEAAYKEGWWDNSSVFSSAQRCELSYIISKSRAAILASIPEKKDDN